EVFETALADRAYDPLEPQFIYPPTESEPYYRAYVNLDEDVADEDYNYLLIDPRSGEILGSVEDFFLADFMYILHYSLNLPFGSYLIGLVTLVFLYVILSGVLIHAKDMVKGFFRYRPGSRMRSQLLDIHNIIGVISLPYTLMLAITGLIFNLVIIYQIAFALILYQGNVDELLSDAGIVTPSTQWLDSPWQSPPIDELFQQQVDKWGTIPTQARITNYGDSGATLEVFGETGEGLKGRYSISYNLADQSINYAEPGSDPNVVTQGIGVVTSLHFGNFAGFDLRAIYFLLGMAVCGLIITGNLLWVGQREKTMSSAKLAFVGRFTLASTAGVAVATAVSFLAERLLPMGLDDRAGLLVYSFVAALLLVTVYVWFAKDRRIALVHLLQCFASLCLLVVSVDLVLFNRALTAALSTGHIAIIGVDAAILGFAVLVAYVSWKLHRRSGQAGDQNAALAGSNSSPATY
ncbi:MAG: PepSY domain-containing protein, partial [Pseudomonadales bacterium]|nr:PepSY domain-containing protein [Pseudomonadales bacterium]